MLPRKVSVLVFEALSRGIIHDETAGGMSELEEM
jgi:hypothetical protein